MRTKVFSFVFALCLGLFSVAAYGQAETGQIIGKVTDPKEAVVLGAQVTFKSVKTGAERTAVSGNDGTYTVTNLQPGLYDVTTTGGGFAASTQRVEVTSGARVSLDTKLGVQAIAGEVTVVSEAGVEVNTTTQE